MSNGGSSGLPHVTEVQLRSDDTISVYIQTASFDAGQEVEVSAYLTQDENSALYNDKKRIPFPDPKDAGQPTTLHVELPATGLDPAKPVAIITRVTEVWPTVLQPNSMAMAEYNDASAGGAYQLKAVWTYQGKAPGDTSSP
jgi:hypothetical protein